jgi:hypothetical protein
MLTLARSGTVAMWLVSLAIAQNSVPPVAERQRAEKVQEVVRIVRVAQGDNSNRTINEVSSSWTPGNVGRFYRRQSFFFHEMSLSRFPSLW